MVDQQNIALATIKYDDAAKLLKEYHFFGPLTRGQSQEVKHGVDRAELQAKLDDYWSFVDAAIRSDVIDGGSEDAQRSFMDDLKSWGQDIASMLFPPDLQLELWKVASQSDILLISTNLGEVPWEALYCADSGSDGEFLSANCVIQRQLEVSQLESKPPDPAANSQIVLLDPELMREESGSGHDVMQILSSRSFKVHETSSKGELARKAREACVIHWICEHNFVKGLRLSRNTFYRGTDIAVHRFPSGCLLFMLSCGSGRLQAGEASFSARIAAASSCTVVAPSSVVAAREAVRFVVDINEVLEDSSVNRLSDAWSLLKNPLGGRTAGAGITIRDCYLLWFGIYGDCNVTLRRTIRDIKN